MKRIRVKSTWLYYIVIVCFSCCWETISRGDDNDNINKKYVIGIRNHGAGFFSDFLGVLNHVAWCDQNGLTPVVYWGRNSFYFQEEGCNGSSDPWEYYFEPVSKLLYDSKQDKIHTTYEEGYMRTRFFFTEFATDKRKYAHDLIERYIKIKQPIMDKVDQFYNDNMAGKKTIGLHLRGTDRVRERDYVPAEMLIAQANTYAGQAYQFFVATDEQALLAKAQNLLHDKMIFYDAYRAAPHNTSVGLFYHNVKGAKLGEDILVETLLLSRCEKLICQPSNVTTAALFFNPALESICVKK